MSVFIFIVNTNHLALSQDKLSMIPCDINTLRSGYSIRESLVRMAVADGVKLGKELPKGHSITVFPNLAKWQDWSITVVPNLAKWQDSGAL